MTALAGALGCETRSRDLLTGHRLRSAAGDYRLMVWGPARAVRWLLHNLDEMLAGLDTAAAAATRKYAAWLRDGCPPDDHMPAERPSLRARWRREYLRVYGRAVAARISGTVVPPPSAASGAELYRGHWAYAAAVQDAARAELARYTFPAVRQVEPSYLLVAPAAAVEGRPAGALPGPEDPPPPGPVQRGPIRRWP